MHLKKCLNYLFIHLQIANIAEKLFIFHMQTMFRNTVKLSIKKSRQGKRFLIDCNVILVK